MESYWSRLKFVYVDSLTKKYIAGPYGNFAISNQTYFTTISLAWRVLPRRRASVCARETMR